MKPSSRCSFPYLSPSLLVPRFITHFSPSSSLEIFSSFFPLSQKKREREKKREKKKRSKKNRNAQREREREAAAAFDSNQFPFDIFFPSLAPLFLTIFICIFPPLSLSLSLFFGSLVNVSPFCFVRIKGDSGSLNTDSISNC